MLNEVSIIVDKKGGSVIEGHEKSDSCFRLSELAKAAGKVISDEESDHTPVYHDVEQKAS